MRDLKKQIDKQELVSTLLPGAKSCQLYMKKTQTKNPFDGKKLMGKT